MRETTSEIKSVLMHSIEQFLYLEAKLLDEGRFEEWFDLLAEDIWYSAPQAEFVDGADTRLDTIGAHHFDEDKTAIGNRIGWLTSGLNNSECPPSLKTRLIGNVRLVDRHNDSSVEVESAFLIWQCRWDGNTAIFAGRREDLLRPVGETWRIARRRIFLASPTLPRSLTTFF